MFDREAILPLAIGLCVAIFLHIATAAGVVVLRELQPGEAIGVEPASQRDLVAVELAVTEPRVAGRPVTITATVENVGMEPASPVSLLVHVDDEIVGRWQSPSALAPRQSTTRKFEYTAKTPGAKSVRLFVDPDDAVVESDELNNKQVETIVWLAPDVEAGARPDLAVVHLDVPAPRVAGRPSPVIIDVANLGGVAESPTEIVLARNGKPLGVIPLPEPPRPGQVARLVGDITVDEAGQHTLNATVDAMRKVDDRNRRNNTLARTFEWTRPRPELKVGQLEESPVSVNWISHEAFEDLLARKSEFDQATVQKTVDPVPVKQAPVDPTPPAPVTVAQKSQPTPPSPTPQKTSPSDTPRKTQPTERVAQPTQPVEFTEDQPKKIEQAPMLAKANPVAEAAAPKQDAPTPPSKIDKTSADADTPKPVTQPDANPRPEPAPKETATPAKELALVTPRVKPSKDGDPVLPKPVETPSEPTDEPKRVAPDVEPDPDAEAAQESAKQEGERMKRPEVAALTLPPVPTIEPGTPEKQPPKRDPDAVKSKVPDRPVDPDAEEADGRQKKQEETEKETPKQNKKQQRPTARTSVARPTAAPKDTREAPPVTRIENEVVRPGKVIAQQGVKINTVRPRYSAVALRTAIPSNPDVKIVFDKGGKVLHAEFVKSTGYDNVDGPLLASFYKWTAEGEGLKRVRETFTLRVHILLGGDD